LDEPYEASDFMSIRTISAMLEKVLHDHRQQRVDRPNTDEMPCPIVWKSADSNISQTA
jgi:hypothetical protein